ncbi:hypothetical protein AYK20_02450 [Thermoplasmatales archaeon SG8-52-1]|nr:MAG: hypothetical protein AYK20_02450 [Thermoplasmatales archaeon SG8-52-1]
MNKKIIGFIVFLLLIGFSVLSKADIVIDNKNVEELSIDDNYLKKPTFAESYLLDFWIEQDKLESNSGTSGDYFGNSVAIDGNYAIVGSNGDDSGTGSANIYIRSGTSWVEQQKLVSSDSDVGDYFGCSVAIDGNYAIVGAFGDDGGTGSAYVFNRSGTNWVEEYKLVSSNGEVGDFFGCSVAIDGNYAIVGAYGDDNNTGAVYVYNNSVGVWIEEIKLIAPDFETGDYFGSSVSIDGNFVIVGAYGDDDYSGSAYILEVCCYWKWREKVNSSSGLPYFGWSVGINGNYAIVGAPGEPNSNSPGSAYVFNRDGNRWYEQTNWSGENIDDYLGISVAIDGNYAIVGSNGVDSITGSAYIFNRTGTNWIEEQRLVTSDGEVGDNFGCSVAIYAGYALIGANGDENSTGSAYVFLNSGIPDLSIEISGGFGVKAKITNNGDNEVKNLDFTIFIKGGIFGMINRSFNYQIDILPSESKIVTSDIFIGIGKIDILAFTDFDEKNVLGIHLLFFSIVY